MTATRAMASLEPALAADRQAIMSPDTTLYGSGAASEQWVRIGRGGRVFLSLVASLLPLLWIPFYTSCSLMW
jgi:hypothetical protein